ncbi:hypothetical protein F2Q69_00022355 [Brassica cretica]|uniref:Uncharacterized protein n=1 Tax=Brassica cretica TaxID=69181 RepID=A0A8S9QBB7_BRACR|nr:hypothetical protein F2Q69_00022355 [Brassica cretica]
MNFPNRRFSSPCIREYQTSKGDSGPRKKRPEPKPILHEPKMFTQSNSCPNQKHCKDHGLIVSAHHENDKHDHFPRRLDQTEVFMSDHASPTARVIPSDHSVHADHNFPLDHSDQTVRTDPSDHPDRTARAVHRIDPQTFNLQREESEDVHRFFLMALLVRPACPEGCPDVLASVLDPLMDLSHPYLTKAWKLSCLKTFLTPVHIFVMKINRRVMWSVRRVCGSSRVCPILPIMDLHDQNESAHQLKSHFRSDLEIKSL